MVNQRLAYALGLVFALGAVPLTAQTPTAGHVLFGSGLKRGTATGTAGLSVFGAPAVGPTGAAGTDSSNAGYGPAAWLLGRGPLIYTFAGTANPSQESSGNGGPATDAKFDDLPDVAVDHNGWVYLAERDGSRIRKVDPVTGVVSVVAGITVGTAPNGYAGDGGPAALARINRPMSVAVDANGNIYFAGLTSHAIRKIDASTGIITTVAGTGASGFAGDGNLAIDAKMNEPEGVHVAANGDIYIADTRNHRIRKIDRLTGVITTVAGTGTNAFGGDGGAATSADLNWPAAVFATGAAPDTLYIADRANHRVRQIDATGDISTVAGGGSDNDDGGAATAFALNEPRDVLRDADGDLFVTDSNDGRVRRINAGDQAIWTLAGTSQGGTAGDGDIASAATMDRPYGLALDGRGHLLVADRFNDRVRRVPWAADAPSGNGSDGRLTATAVVGIGDSLYLQIDDADITAPSSLSALVVNVRTGEQETVSGSDWAGANGVFTSDILTADGTGESTDDNGTLGVADGDQINIWYTDADAASRSWSANLLASASVVRDLGDVDADGDIDTFDVIAILNHYNGAAPLVGAALLPAHVTAGSLFEDDEADADADPDPDPDLDDAIALLTHYLLLQRQQPSILPVDGATSANRPPHTVPAAKLIRPALPEREVALQVRDGDIDLWIDDRAGLVSAEVRIAGVEGAAALHADMADYAHSSVATDGNAHVVLVGPGTVSGPGTVLTFSAPTGIRPALVEVVLNQGATPARIGVPQTLPTSFVLDANYPNPFNPATTIRFALPQAGRVRLDVFDVLGQKVATLAEGDWPVGFHRVEWDGRDQRGRAAASGVYFYRLEVGDAESRQAATRFVEIRRMLLLK